MKHLDPHLLPAAGTIAIINENDDQEVRNPETITSFQKDHSRMILLLLEAGLIKKADRDENKPKLFPYHVTWRGLQFLGYYNYLDAHGLLTENRPPDQINSRLFTF